MSRSGRSIALNRRGMSAFLVVWSGQFLSQVGTLMTSLALIFWAYDRTGRATELALMAFFTLGPRVLFGPIAGAMIDRWNRKSTLLLTDTLAALVSASILVLLVTGNLRIWHLYLLTFCTGLFSVFQEPAFLASATMMVPARHYGRTGGLTALLTHASAILAPAVAGVLLPWIGLRGILIADIGTFLFAMLTLAWVRIPEPPSEVLDAGRSPRHLLRDVRAGLRYLTDHRSLLFLLLLFASTNFFGSVYSTLYRAMLLARTGGSEGIVVTVQLLIGIGGTAGALYVTLFGAPRRKVPAILIGYACGALFRALFGIDVGWPFVAAFGLLTTACMAFAAGCSNALWQSKIPPALQGRVLATRLALAGAISLSTRLMAGPLADHVFEPAMVPGGSLVGAFGWLAGTGPGAGMGLYITLSCSVGACVLLWGLTRRSIRHLDTLVPDHGCGLQEGA